MTSCWIPAWRFGALLAVAAVAMANLVQTTRRVPAAAREVDAATFDPLTWHEQRFASLRARAAALGVTGTIGYIGDHDTADDDYYYAQFALAPLLLDIEPAPHAWAVANLRTTPAAARITGEWAVAEDFGSGVLLLRKSAR